MGTFLFPMRRVEAALHGFSWPTILPRGDGIEPEARAGLDPLSGFRGLAGRWPGLDPGTDRTPASSG